MTAEDINNEMQATEELRRFVTLGKMLIDHVMMGNDYLILFVKRDRWREFEERVRELDKKVNAI